MDSSLDAIDVDPESKHDEAESNTVNPSEQPDVIASYTAGQDGDADDGGADENGPAEDGEDPGTEDGQALEPLTEQEETQQDIEAEGSEAGPVADRGTEAGPGQPEPGEATGFSAEPERPAAPDAEQPVASTSRPFSGVSARPASGRPGSAVHRRSPVGSGSRPGSSSHVQLTPDSVGLPASAEEALSAAAATAIAAAAGASAAASAQTSRPGTSSSSSRPASRPSSQDAGLGRSPPSREAPPLPPTIPEDQPLHPARIERYIATGLKAIDVEIEQGPGLPHRMLRVLMDLTQQDHKPYVGGYRNKRTGAVYHHAGTQTPRQPKYSEADRKLSRETQTVKIKQHSQQTVREQATQMERPGVLLDTTYDRVVTPGRYQTADERDVIVEAATRCIQRWCRGWLGRRRAVYLRGKKAEREAFLREQEQRAQTEAEEHRRREIQRRMHPRTAADFEVLYNELEAWRLQETRKVKEAGLAKEQEQQVLQQLLHKETKLLQTIDRLKINANQENKEARIQQQLNEMAKPKKFTLRNGGKVDVHTPFTTRAKELQQLYNGLNLPLLTVDERLDVLLHVKWTVKEFDCDLTREIVALIDREADLLNRGRSPAVLEGLRKRISSLFLNFIETPEFNPEATKFQIVPMDFETYLYEQVGKASSKTGLAMVR